ncbi:DeoR family transcriptional regulator [Streptomyces monticola]|uniref:Lactose phosphotransferase system repressor n=1 Tax=Streptomyces monticola TaxID=2666263 RepID=A0ABW2JEH9_9ACTN
MLNTPERREQLARLVLDQGYVPVEDLVRELGVSRYTVYRDLSLLEAEGRLRRVRCGAAAFPSARFADAAQWRDWHSHADAAAPLGE